MSEPLLQIRPICRGGWCLSFRAHLYKGGSITSRPYKKFVPLLKIIFYVAWPFLEPSYGKYFLANGSSSTFQLRSKKILNSLLLKKSSCHETTTTNDFLAADIPRWWWCTTDDSKLQPSKHIIYIVIVFAVLTMQVGKQ